MFKDDNVAVSIGTRHKQSTELTVLLGGRVEFNSFKHRRDAFDVMLHYDLWVKPHGEVYEAGSHGSPGDSFDKIACVALTNAAYNKISVLSDT